MMVIIGDWLYFHAAVDDYIDNTIFGLDYGVLYLKDALNPIHALYDDGDVNVNDPGFEVQVNI